MTEQISRDEAIEIYGDIVVKFSSYYKYSFTFSGSRDGVTIALSLGGDHNDIYKLSVDADNETDAGGLLAHWYPNYINRTIDDSGVVHLWEPF